VVDNGRVGAGGVGRRYGDQGDVDLHGMGAQRWRGWREGKPKARGASGRATGQSGVDGSIVVREYARFRLLIQIPDQYTDFPENSVGGTTESGACLKKLFAVPLIVTQLLRGQGRVSE
jgi:hypothetical protein